MEEGVLFTFPYIQCSAWITPANTTKSESNLMSLMNLCFKSSSEVPSVCTYLNLRNDVMMVSRQSLKCSKEIWIGGSLTGRCRMMSKSTPTYKRRGRLKWAYCVDMLRQKVQRTLYKRLLWKGKANVSYPREKINVWRKLPKAPTVTLLLINEVQKVNKW